MSFENPSLEENLENKSEQEVDIEVLLAENNLKLSEPKPKVMPTDGSRSEFSRQGTLDNAVNQAANLLIKNRGDATSRYEPKSVFRGEEKSPSFWDEIKNYLKGKKIVYLEEADDAIIAEIQAQEDGQSYVFLWPGQSMDQFFAQLDRFVDQEKTKFKEGDDPSWKFNGQPVPILNFAQELSYLRHHEDPRLQKNFEVAFRNEHEDKTPEYLVE